VVPSLFAIILYVNCHAHVFLLNNTALNTKQITICFFHFFHLSQKFHPWILLIVHLFWRKTKNKAFITTLVLKKSLDDNLQHQNILLYIQCKMVLTNSAPPPLTSRVSNNTPPPHYYGIKKYPPYPLLLQNTASTLPQPRKMINNNTYKFSLFSVQFFSPMMKKENIEMAVKKTRKKR